MCTPISTQLFFFIYIDYCVGATSTTYLTRAWDGTVPMGTYQSTGHGIGHMGLGPYSPPPMLDVKEPICFLLYIFHFTLPLHHSCIYSYI